MCKSKVYELDVNIIFYLIGFMKLLVFDHDIFRCFFSISELNNVHLYCVFIIKYYRNIRKAKFVARMSRNCVGITVLTDSRMLLAGGLRETKKLHKMYLHANWFCHLQPGKFWRSSLQGNDFCFNRLIV